jgi:hypothetical protein
VDGRHLVHGIDPGGPSTAEPRYHGVVLRGWAILGSNQ